jgi:5'-nucleotidase
MNRAQFIKNGFKATASVALASVATNSFANTFFTDIEKEKALKQLSILHTNDVHSRLDAFPDDGGKYAGLGGIAARAKLLEQIRQETLHTLLLDSGDMFQGTPYFNLYKGEAEILAMNKLGYECGTLGNHDFDAGLDNLMMQLNKANFSTVVCNYDFTNTCLEDKIAPYQIIHKGKLKIGIIGVGIELSGLVPKDLFGNTIYQNPVERVNYFAKLLRQKNCDLIICLSHLGYSYDNKKVSDKILAAETYDVDLILGGHTHTFLDEPIYVQNKRAQRVCINQVGFGGIKLGRLDFDFFQQNNSKKTLQSHSGVLVK